MAEFRELTAQSLWFEDETWQQFQTDWRAQCAELGEDFDDFAPDVTELLRQVAAGETEQTKINKSSICAIKDGEGRYWAVAQLNWVKHLPGTSGPTVRVRHLTACPSLDFGAEEVDIYAQVLIGSLFGFLSVSEQHYQVREMKMHVRSPADVAFFTALGSNLARSERFERVETRGAWLYISLTEGANNGDA